MNKLPVSNFLAERMADPVWLYRFGSLDRASHRPPPHMDRQSHSNGLETFLEHWGLLITVVIALTAGKALDFFMALSGTPWIWFFVASFAFMVVGGGLIVYAKLPVYRSGRFFTFGLKSVPEQLHGCYRWGWRVFLFGVVLGLCLLLSRP